MEVIKISTVKQYQKSTLLVYKYDMMYGDLGQVYLILTIIIVNKKIYSKQLMPI